MFVQDRSQQRRSCGSLLLNSAPVIQDTKRPMAHVKLLSYTEIRQPEIV